MTRRFQAPDRIRVRRQPKKGRYDRASVEAILDRGLVAHIAFVDRGEPVCIPTFYVRSGDELYVHGSRASRAMRLWASGERVCVTVTLLHGLVLARSVFEHSANYESVVAFGCFRLIDDEAERLAALQTFTNRVVPDRWDEVRSPNAKELKATMILAMPLSEASAKVRFGPPDDDDSDDAALDVWAGELPIATSFGEPIPSPGLRPTIPLPNSIRSLADLMAATEAE